MIAVEGLPDILGSEVRAGHVVNWELLKYTGRYILKDSPRGGTPKIAGTAVELEFCADSPE
ncbi:hypothetical protein [Polluticaenibacter yanchengensis]|uniref:PASTA domain-containing protein n=1 Tax=Polluticaenibacter yanchengensis TaxID=3014562 RepID=A0ABT4UP70_9BACT|nr:hypothetical protein [Chitinophagaceae bacterium LY-5]